MKYMPLTSGIVRALRRGQAKILLVTGLSFWWPADNLSYGQRVWVAWDYTRDKPANVNGKEVLQPESKEPGQVPPLPPASPPDEDMPYHIL